MRLVTPIFSPHTGKTDFAVWEYDETKPRNLSSDDPRQRYAVKKFIDTYRSKAEALEAAEA